MTAPKCPSCHSGRVQPRGNRTSHVRGQCDRCDYFCSQEKLEELIYAKDMSLSRTAAAYLFGGASLSDLMREIRAASGSNAQTQPSTPDNKDKPNG